MSGLTTVALFLVSLLFSLLIFTLWLRIAVRYFRISALNPLSQLIHTITDPLIEPIQFVVKQKPKSGDLYDIPTIILLILVELVKIILISLIAFHGLMNIGYLVLYVLADLILQPCDLLFFVILIRVIMSFVNPAWNGPIADFLRIITEPLLKLGRKIIPDISGFDFSPFIILMILKVITLFINASLPWRLL
ncbi:MAG: YggT family protein [Legionella sp.]|uniref:YggT family protein n=1 Tax=Legionella sp. TaxID=459 RepID=UPI0039E33402